jgi:hypothetical protein
LKSSLSSSLNYAGVAAFLVGTGVGCVGFAAYTGLAGGLKSSLSSSLNYAGVAAFFAGAA